VRGTAANPNPGITSTGKHTPEDFAKLLVSDIAPLGKLIRDADERSVDKCAYSERPRRRRPEQIGDELPSPRQGECVSIRHAGARNLRVPSLLTLPSSSIKFGVKCQTYVDRYIAWITKLSRGLRLASSKRVEKAMTINNTSEAAKAVVRRNTAEVQGGGNFEVFDELFADDFLDHTPQPGRTPDKDGARQLYKILRTAFPDFHAEIHWQLADGDRVTTYKTYHGTHRGEFLGVAPTGRKIQFETVDVMRVRNGKITEHWGVANLFSLMQQLGAWPAKQDRS
jgi:steroid delta-isomerase-like uncharacterized protein